MTAENHVDLKKGHLETRIYYGLLAAILAYTLIAQCLLTHQQGRSLANTFSYFTIQSNVLVLITSTILAIKPTTGGTWWRLLRLAALAGITVTGIVYALVLAPYVHLTGAALLYDYIFHYLMPFATVIGFVFIEPWLKLIWRDMVFMVWPAAWLVYTMVRGAVFKPEFRGFSEGPSHYPYGFLDVDNNPFWKIVVAIIIITVLLTAVGAAYVWFDRRKQSRLQQYANKT